MPRRARTIVGGYAYHVLNRANGRLRLFKKNADFAAFERVLAETHGDSPLLLRRPTFGRWPRKRGQSPSRGTGISPKIFR